MEAIYEFANDCKTLLVRTFKPERYHSSIFFHSFVVLPHCASSRYTKERLADSCGVIVQERLKSVVSQMEGLP